MATLNVKNLPDALYRKLKARAKRERRSVAQEVTILLTEALERAAPARFWSCAVSARSCGATLMPPTMLRASERLGADRRSRRRASRHRYGGLHLFHRRKLAVLCDYCAAVPSGDAGELELVASALTLLEVLVVPYRAGNVELAERYEAMLTRSRGVRMIDLTQDHMRLAAQLRAAMTITTPDALQLAACLASRCSAFVTNDRRLPTIPG
jgi:plasmid stability protein/predicted nucleic acid-binding protein